MLIASSSSFFSIDLQSPALSLRSSANRLYVYKWKHLNEKIWRKWVLYLLLKDELTLLQIRLFVYFDNILLNPALWFRGWTLRFERDAIMWRVILNPKQPSFRTKLGIYHLHTIPHVLKFLYRACTTFSFSLPSLFFIHWFSDRYIPPRDYFDITEANKWFQCCTLYSRILLRNK